MYDARLKNYKLVSYAHNERTVAARFALCINANSPNDFVDVSDSVETCLPSTITANDPAVEDI